MTSCHDFYDGDIAREVVVVGVDGSPGSKAALQWAVDHALTSGAKVVAVNVFEPVVPLDFTGAGFAAMSVTDPRQLRQTGLDLIDRMVAETDRGRSVDVQPLVIEAPNPGQALVRAAHDASMLVVGAHHRHGLGFLLGSTAASCVRHAGCPVVVVPEALYAGPPESRRPREVVAT